MSKIIIPANYTPALNLYDTQRAIGTVKRLFADTLCATLNLYRVSAPLFVEASTGLNDDLNGVERKVTFDTKDSGIESLEDLVGKHISVGAAGSTTVDEATVHLSLLGKTLDDLKAEYMGTSESADAISNEQLDGVWVMAGTPNAAVTQIMTTTDAKILPIPAETVEALKVNYPWYASYTIPAGTYAGQDEDVPTSAVKLTLFINADVDEETVYQMTKTFWEKWDYLTETHAALKKASLEAACTDLAGVPIHEGAARYYREVGVLE